MSALAGRGSRRPLRWRDAAGERWAELAIALALALWALGPVVYLLAHARASDATFTGADGGFAVDQLQYLAWIRSSGLHLLAADDFALRLGGHVYLQPMFVISGLLWRAGLGIAASYLIWLPVACAALFIGFRAYTHRMLGPGLARVGVLALALFFVTPGEPLAGWTVGSPGLDVVGGELSPSGSLWGYFPSAIAVGLLAGFALCLARAVDQGETPPARSPVWYAGCAALLGLAVSWLHPWQGETALAIAAVMLVLNRFRAAPHVLLAMAGTAAPLAYYFALSRSDAAWRLGQSASAGTRPGVGVLFLGLLPLLIFAAAARPWLRESAHEQVLVIWPVVAVALYFLSTGYSPHALEGISLPLAVLAARGWQRMRLPAVAAAVAIAVATLPGLVYEIRALHRAVSAGRGTMYLTRDETRAMHYLAREPQPGGVLPSVSVATAVPAFTGRRTWLGHPGWTPDYAARVHAVSELFSGALSTQATRRLLRTAGARWVLADCESSAAGVRLAALADVVRSYGCVRIYRLPAAVVRSSVVSP